MMRFRVLSLIILQCFLVTQHFWQQAYALAPSSEVSQLDVQRAADEVAGIKTDGAATTPHKLVLDMPDDVTQIPSYKRFYATVLVIALVSAVLLTLFGVLGAVGVLHMHGMVAFVFFVGVAIALGVVIWAAVRYSKSLQETTRIPGARINPQHPVEYQPPVLPTVPATMLGGGPAVKTLTKMTQTEESLIEVPAQQQHVFTAPWQQEVAPLQQVSQLGLDGQPDIPDMAGEWPLGLRGVKPSAKKSSSSDSDSGFGPGKGGQPVRTAVKPVVPMEDVATWTGDWREASELSVEAPVAVKVVVEPWWLGAGRFDDIQDQWEAALAGQRAASDKLNRALALAERQADELDALRAQLAASQRRLQQVEGVELVAAKQQVADLQKQVSTLEAKLADSLVAAQRAQELVAQKEADLRVATAELKNQQDTQRILEQRLEAQAAELLQAQRGQGEADKTALLAQTQFQEAEGELKRSKLELEQAQMRTVEAQSDAQASRLQMVQSDAELKRLRAQVVQLQGDLHRAELKSATLDAVQAELVKAKESLRAAETAQSQAVASTKEQEGVVAQLRARVAALEADLQQAIAQKATIDDLRSQLRFVQEALRAAEAERTQIKTEGQRALEAVSQELQHLKVVYEENQSLLAKYQSMKDLAKQLSVSDDAADIQALERRVKDLERTLNAGKKLVDQLLQENAALQAALDEWEDVPEVETVDAGVAADLQQELQSSPRLAELEDRSSMKDWRVWAGDLEKDKVALKLELRQAKDLSASKERAWSESLSSLNQMHQAKLKGAQDESDRLSQELERTKTAHLKALQDLKNKTAIEEELKNLKAEALRLGEQVAHMGVLQTQVDELRTQLQKATATNDELTTQQGQAVDNLAALQAQHEQDRQDWAKHVAALEQRLVNSDGEVSALRSALEKEQGAVAQLQNLLEAFRLAEGEHEEERAKAKASLLEAHQAVEALRGQLRTAGDGDAELMNQLQALQELVVKLEGLAEQLAAQRADYEQALAEKQTAEDRNRSLAAEIEALKANHARALAILEGNLSTEQELGQRLGTEMNSQTEELARLRAEVTRLKDIEQRLEEMHARWQSAQVQNGDLVAKLKAQDAAVADLTQRLEAATRAQSTSDAEKLKELDRLRAALLEAQRGRDVIAQEKEDLQGLLAKTTENQQQAVADLEAQVAEWRSMFEAEQRAKGEAEQARLAAAAALVQLKIELAQLQAREQAGAAVLKERDAELQRLKDKIAANDMLIAELRAKADRVDALEKDLAVKKTLLEAEKANMKREQEAKEALDAKRKLLEAQVADLTAVGGKDRAALLETLKDLRGSLAGLKNSKEKHKQKITSLEENVFSLEKDLAVANSELSRLRGLSAPGASPTKTFFEGMQDQAADTFADEKKRLEAEIQQLRDDNGVLAQRVAEVQGEKQALEKRLQAEHDAALKELKQNNAIAIGEKERLSREKEDALALAKKANKDMEAEMENLQNRLKDLERVAPHSSQNEFFALKANVGNALEETSLRRQLADLEKQNAKALSQVASLEAENENLRKDLLALQQEKDSLEGDLREWDRKFSELQGVLQNEKQANNKVKEAIANKKIEIDEAVKKALEETHAAQLSTANSYSEKLKTSVTDLQSQLARKDVLLAELENKLKNMESLNKELEKINENLVKESTSWQNLGLDTSRNFGRRPLSFVEGMGDTASYELFQEEIAALQESLNRALATLAQKNAVISEMKQLLEEAAAHQRDWDKAKNSYENDIEDLTESLEEAQGRVRDLVKQEEDLWSKIRSIATKVQNLLKGGNNGKSQLVIEDGTIVDAVSTLDREMERVVESMQSLRNDNNNLNEELQNVKVHLDTTKNQLATEQKKAKEDLFELQNNYDEAEAGLKKAAEENRKASAAQERLNTKLEAVVKKTSMVDVSVWRKLGENWLYLKQDDVASGLRQGELIKDIPAKTPSQGKEAAPTNFFSFDDNDREVSVNVRDVELAQRLVTLTAIRLISLLLAELAADAPQTAGLDKAVGVRNLCDSLATILSYLPDPSVCQALQELVAAFLEHLGTKTSDMRSIEALSLDNLDEALQRVLTYSLQNVQETVIFENLFAEAEKAYHSLFSLLPGNETEWDDDRKAKLRGLAESIQATADQARELQENLVDELHAVLEKLALDRDNSVSDDAIFELARQMFNLRSMDEDDASIFVRTPVSSHTPHLFSRTPNPNSRTPDPSSRRLPAVPGTPTSTLVFAKPQPAGAQISVARVLTATELNERGLSEISVAGKAVRFEERSQTAIASNRTDRDGAPVISFAPGVMQDFANSLGFIVANEVYQLQHVNDERYQGQEGRLALEKDSIVHALQMQPQALVQAYVKDLAQHMKVMSDLSAENLAALKTYQEFMMLMEQHLAVIQTSSFNTATPLWDQLNAALPDLKLGETFNDNFTFLVAA